MAELLPDQISELVEGAALKTSSKKNKSNLANTITSLQSTKKSNETVQNPNEEFLDKISPLIGTDEIEEFENGYLQPSVQSSIQRSLEAREQTQEESLCWGLEEMFNAEAKANGLLLEIRVIMIQTIIAPMNIYENRVLLIGIHNLSKSCQPNIITIGVLLLGTKFIPIWKFEKIKNVFTYFNDFIRQMYNKV